MCMTGANNRAAERHKCRYQGYCLLPPDGAEGKGCAHDREASESHAVDQILLQSCWCGVRLLNGWSVRLSSLPFLCASLALDAGVKVLMRTFARGAGLSHGHC